MYIYIYIYIHIHLYPRARAAPPRCRAARSLLYVFACALCIMISLVCYVVECVFVIVIYCGVSVCYTCFMHVGWMIISVLYICINIDIYIYMWCQTSMPHWPFASSDQPRRVPVQSFILFTLLDLCVSSLRRGHANIFCIVPISTHDPRREVSSVQSFICYIIVCHIMSYYIV